jgi:hypothetical protein
MIMSTITLRPVEDADLEKQLIDMHTFIKKLPVSMPRRRGVLMLRPIAGPQSRFRPSRPRRSRVTM